MYRSQSIFSHFLLVTFSIVIVFRFVFSNFSLNEFCCFIVLNILGVGSYDLDLKKLLSLKKLYQCREKIGLNGSDYQKNKFFEI